MTLVVVFNTDGVCGQTVYQFAGQLLNLLMGNWRSKCKLYRANVASS